MTFYHIVITHHDGTKYLLARDSERSDIETILKTFKRHKVVIFDSTKITPRSIKDLIVVVTDRDLDATLDGVNEQLRGQVERINAIGASHMAYLPYGELQAGAVGKNVTDEFLPFEQSYPSILGNPWLISIVSGLIVGLLLM